MNTLLRRVSGLLLAAVYAQPVLAIEKAPVPTPPEKTTAAPMKLPSGVSRPAAFDKLGIQVMSYTKGPGSMNVWRIKKSGVDTVMYSTPDNSVLISGVMWDASSAANLSDAYLPDNPQALPSDVNPPPSAQSAPPPNVVDANGVPQAVKNLAGYFGFKEGQGTADKTLYVIFDPKCPYCHQAYNALRDQVNKGLSVMWIPIVVLGDEKARSESMKWIAEAQKEKNPSLAMAKLFGKQYKGIEFGKDLVQNLIKSEMFLQASYRENPSAGSIGVPTAYFATKENAPSMMQIGDPATLKLALNSIKR